jgi:hypothetical protein
MEVILTDKIIFWKKIKSKEIFSPYFFWLNNIVNICVIV